MNEGLEITFIPNGCYSCKRCFKGCNYNSHDFENMPVNNAYLSLRLHSILVLEVECSYYEKNIKNNETFI